MRAQGAIVQGGLAAASLLLAYATWQREPDKNASDVTVLAVGKSELTKVRYEDGAKWVELTAQGSGDDRQMWLRISAKPESKTPERELKGNEAALKLYERFTPLRATRALGLQPEAKLKELGLEKPTKHLAISTKGATTQFAIGSSTYAVSDPYVYNEQDKNVFVLGRSILSDLDNAASRLVDRSLHKFKATDYDAISVSANQKRRDLSLEGDAPAKLLSAKTHQPDVLAKNWHDKVFSLYVTEPLGKGEVPADGEPQVRFRVDYSHHKKGVGFVEVAKLTPARAPAVSTAPPPATYYARSEYTPGWVKIAASAEDLIKESEKIASAD